MLFGSFIKKIKAPIGDENIHMKFFHTQLKIKKIKAPIGDENLATNKIFKF